MSTEFASHKIPYGFKQDIQSHNSTIKYIIKCHL